MEEEEQRISELVKQGNNKVVYSYIVKETAQLSVEADTTAEETSTKPDAQYSYMYKYKNH